MGLSRSNAQPDEANIASAHNQIPQPPLPFVRRSEATARTIVGKECGDQARIPRTQETIEGPATDDAGARRWGQPSWKTPVEGHVKGRSYAERQMEDSVVHTRWLREKRCIFDVEAFLWEFQSFFTRTLASCGHLVLPTNRQIAAFVVDSRQFVRCMRCRNQTRPVFIISRSLYFWTNSLWDQSCHCGWGTPGQTADSWLERKGRWFNKEHEPGKERDQLPKPMPCSQLSYSVLRPVVYVCRTCAISVLSQTYDWMPLSHSPSTQTLNLALYFEASNFPGTWSCFDPPPVSWVIKCTCTAKLHMNLASNAPE